VTLGILYVYAIGPFVNYSLLAIMCGILPVIWFILVLLVLPESPTYLWRSGKNKEAEDALVMLRGKDYDISGELQALQKELEEKKPNGKLKDMVKSRATLRAAFTVLGLLAFLSCSGINVVIFYAESIFACEHCIISPKASSIVIGILQVSTPMAATVFTAVDCTKTSPYWFFFSDVISYAS